MNAKQDALSQIDQLDDSANWVDVKNTIMKSYKRETGDATADAIAALTLIATFVCASVFWVSIQ